MAIASLQPLVGAWDARFEVVSGPDKVSGEAIDTYCWLVGEKVLLHQTKGAIGGRATEAVELFYEHDGIVRSWSVMADGTVTESRVTMTPQSVEIDGETERFRGRVESPDRIAGEWQRLEKGDWSDWMTLTLERRG